VKKLPREKIVDRVKRIVYPHSKTKETLEQYKNIRDNAQVEVEKLESDVKFISGLSEKNIRDLSRRVRDWLAKEFPEHEALIELINQEEDAVE
jgi:hypothetical protein